MQEDNLTGPNGSARMSSETQGLRQAGFHYGQKRSVSKEMHVRNLPGTMLFGFPDFDTGNVFKIEVMGEDSGI